MQCNEAEHYLTASEERLLLRIARDTLTQWVRDRIRPPLDSHALTTSLRKEGAAFVTIRNGDTLRGCMGCTGYDNPLAEAVRDNTINAAANDPRFSPITFAELDDVHLDISVLTPGDTPLTPFRHVNNINEIRVGSDGLYIRQKGDRGGLLLPQVAVEHRWDVPAFLEAVCRKAGYPESSWRDESIDLFRFSAQVFSELDHPRPAE